MGRGATKACGNVWFEARIAAAKYNDQLSSRSGAAELLNLSEDAVKSAELGLYKAMPVDNAVLMADLYNAPELLNYYCLHECPIGKNRPISAEVVSIDRATIKLLRRLQSGVLTDLRDKLLEISEDGVISDDELPILQEIVDNLDGISRAASELKIIGQKAMRGGDPGGPDE